MRRSGPLGATFNTKKGRKKRRHGGSTSTTRSPLRPRKQRHPRRRKRDANWMAECTRCCWRNQLDNSTGLPSNSEELVGIWFWNISCLHFRRHPARTHTPLTVVVHLLQPMSVQYSIPALCCTKVRTVRTQHRIYPRGCSLWLLQIAWLFYYIFQFK